MLQASFFEYLKGKADTKSLLLICEDDTQAAELGDTARFCGKPTYILPDFRALHGDDLRSYHDELTHIFSTLHSYFRDSSKDKILISPFRTIAKPLPSKEHFGSVSLLFADKLRPDEFKHTLYGWGYEFVDIVESPGEASFRGDIIDLFSPNYEQPIRIGLFDDDIESLRFFDNESQRSIKEELESIEIFPAFLALSSQEFEELESRAKTSTYDTFYKDVGSLGLWLIEGKKNYLQELNPMIARLGGTELNDYYDGTQALVDKSFFEGAKRIDDAKKYSAHEIVNLKDALQVHKDKKITIIAKNEVVLKSYEVDTGKAKIVLEDFVINLLSDDELIISLNKKENKKRLKKSNIVVDDLKVGDYVVHSNYGIGLFCGLKQVKTLGAMRDFVELAYQGEDRLLLPVENLSLIDRYVYDSGSIPVVDRLGKGSFAKLKESVKKKLFEIANEIVRLAALRELKEGTKVGCADPRLAVFSKSAGFEYTEDQKKSIHEIFVDISSGKAMDRLLSGDVGFGKTEVAMNAAYAVALSGYKTVITTPTTILSSQHFDSFCERFEPFGIRIVRLDRFLSAKERKEALAALERGDFDIAIGTHALLDITAPKVALVIVDEEHKFGVKQKEKLKKLSENAHLLSMSATPIPRSLNMALSRVKSLSEIKTPPKERIGVRTFVKTHDDKLVKEAISRELRRGGQVFYIHNRIADIDEVRASLKALLPSLRIEILHSQVSADETERIMIDFTKAKFDLLLSTSIVESGVNLPNANTIIIDAADNFGIADLHQLRGRVGRGNREGYAYFFVEDTDSITDDAKKRLVALESNSYLGSGAALAFHDLEIRGGGNIVGEAQSGHIKNIGYSLYLRMLEEAINELSGQVHDETAEFEMKLSISAFLSPEYICEDRIRLELYRRLSGAKSSAQLYDIEEEMNDRFGKPDEFTARFLRQMHVKSLAVAKGFVSVSNYTYNVTLTSKDGKKQFLEAVSADGDDILDAVLKYLRL